MLGVCLSFLILGRFCSFWGLVFFYFSSFVFCLFGVCLSFVAVVVVISIFLSFLTFSVGG